MVRKIPATSGGWRKHPASHDTSHALQEAVRQLQSLPWSTDRWRRNFTDHICVRVVGRKRLHPQLMRALQTAVSTIVQIETQPFRTPTTIPASTPQAVELAARVRGIIAGQNQMPQLWHEWSEVLIDALTDIATRAPWHDFTEQHTAPLTLPLIDLIAKPAELVEGLVSHLIRFANDDPFTFRPGQVLAARIQKSLLQHSKLTDGAARRNPFRLVPPAQSGLTGSQLVAAYLGGTFLPALLATSVPFVIPRKAYSEHGALFAKSGHGKTQTLRTIVAGFLQEDDPPALFIMDSLGSLIEDVDKLEVFATRLRDRLVILDPTDERPPALNLFKLGSNSLYHYLFKAIDPTLTMRQATMISNLMLLMQEIEGATLETLIKVCETRENLFPEAVDRLPPVSDISTREIDLAA